MLKLIVAGALLTMSAGAAIAADYSIIPQPQRVAPRRVADVCHVERCGPRGCRVVNLCRCPDRYACYGLYDAYRPYGGTAFLSVYTEY